MECPYKKLCSHFEELKCDSLFYRNYCQTHEPTRVIPESFVKPRLTIEAERKMWEERDLVTRLRELGGL